MTTATMMATTAIPDQSGKKAHKPEATESLLDGYWTLPELAALIGRSPRTLARWHNMRVGPPRTVLGNLVLFDKETTRAWLKAQAEAVASQRAA